MAKNVKDETGGNPPPLKNPRFVSSSLSQERVSIKKQRLADALRENLRKRKEQVRGRKKPLKPE